MSTFEGQIAIMSRLVEANKNHVIRYNRDYQGIPISINTYFAHHPTRIFQEAVHQEMYLWNGSFRDSLVEKDSLKILTVVRNRKSKEMLGINFLNTRTEYGQLPDENRTEKQLLGLNGFYVPRVFRNMGIAGLMVKYHSLRISRKLAELGEDPSKYALSVQDHFYPAACKRVAGGINISVFYYHDMF